MKTAIRRPQINLLTALEAGLTGHYITNNHQQYMPGPRISPNSSLGNTSRHTPHQGAQEKSRRRRQMAAGTHGYPKP